MALDDRLQLHNANVNINANSFNVQGSTIPLGRVGLPRNAQFYVSKQLATVDREVTVALQLSLDNASTWRTIAQHVFDDGSAGIKVMDVAQDFDAQEYADANIDVRVNITATDHGNTNNAGKVAAYLTSGEASHVGRKSTADTLAL